MSICNFVAIRFRLYNSIIISQELKEIDRWLELYETHDKYTFVGHLVDDPVNDILDQVEDRDNVETKGEIIDGDVKNSEEYQESDSSVKAVEG
jgi:hypothetical protein